MRDKSSRVFVEPVAASDKSKLES